MIRARFWAAGIGFAIFAALATSSPAEPLRDDRGGVLYMALAPEIEYAYGNRPCGSSGTPRPDEALVSIEPSQKVRYAFVLAAWPDTVHPELGAVTFGVRASDGVELVRWGACQTVLQAPTENWPASGEGMAIAMAGHRDTSRVIELGWLAIRAPVKGIVELVPHPNPQFAGRFATAGIALEAPVADMGSIGFGLPGRAPVPTFPGPELGAACAFDTLCVRLTAREADAYGPAVIFLGEGVPCAPGLCRPGAPEGACCLADGGCQVMTRKECVRAAGRYIGDATRCEAEPCRDKSMEGGPGR